MDKIHFKYKRENGVIVSLLNHGLQFIDGHPGETSFDWMDAIWELHKMQPGIVHEIAHTHPIGLWEPSSRDKQFLKAMTWALYPFPARLSVITYFPEVQLFNKVTALGILESKESWLARGERDERKYRVILEDNYPIEVDERKVPWIQMLLDESYQHIDKDEQM